MKQYQLVLLFSLLLGFSLNSKAWAQEELIHQNVAEDTLNAYKGAAAKKFGYLCFYTGFTLPDAQLKLMQSNEFGMAFIKKIKLGKVFSIGSDYYFSYRNYRIADTSYYLFPPGSTLVKERMYTRNAGVKPWVRINFGKQNTSLGTYLDLGLTGEWSFSRIHLYKFQNPPGSPEGEMGIYKMKKMDWFAPLNYGFFARVGVKHWSVFVNYRWSSLFKSNPYFTNFTPLTAGIQYALHN